jgi:uncharacterized NAD(P)/FAD-binding protein YdhS
MGDESEIPTSLSSDAPLLLFGEPVAVGRAVLRLLQRGHAGTMTVVLRFVALAFSDRSMGPAHIGRIHVAPADLAIGLSPLRLLRIVRQATRRGLDWRPWIDAIHFHRASLWVRWTPRERRQAQRHLEALFRLHFERWPEVHMDLLTDALDEGQVELVGGRVVGLEPQGDGAIVRIETPQGKRRHAVSAVVWKPTYPPIDD